MILTVKRLQPLNKLSPQRHWLLLIDAAINRVLGVLPAIFPRRATFAAAMSDTGGSRVSPDSVQSLANLTAASLPSACRAC